MPYCVLEAGKSSESASRSPVLKEVQGKVGGTEAIEPKFIVRISGSKSRCLSTDCASPLSLCSPGLWNGE